MKVNFVKMHGLGNDYIYFDCLNQPDLILNPDETARKLADRHFGVGGDGIILILPDDDSDCEMRIFNADGSEGEMCGNGIRCVGKYMYDNAYTRKKTIRIKTKAGILELQLIGEGKTIHNVRVDMGKPILNGLEIPVAVDKASIVNEHLILDDYDYNITCVSMGNPHCVIFVDEITNKLVHEIGPLFENHKLFPQRINVEFVKVISRTEVNMRVWERGSGETMACGTGAAAVAVAGVLTDKTERNVVVHLRGGDLQIEWAANNHVHTTGPATYVFSGQVEI